MSIPGLIALLLAFLAAGLPAGLVAADTSDTAFPRPAALAPAVAFWTRVYTDLDSASGIIHDNRELELVYQVLYLNPDAPPGSQGKAIEKTLDNYRKALLTLASGRRRGLTVIEQQALLPWGEDASDADLRAAAERLRFQRGQADRFQKGLVRSQRWKAHIQRIFRERGLPPELAALPHVESSYHPGARSKAGAAGLWQFMPATARRYLRVDGGVDERLDPYKSSEAAAHLLQHNYSVLKSWPLAITAYNHGLSGMRRAVQATGTSDLDEIVRSYESPSFGFASRNFYAAFLAALDVSRDPERYFASSRPGEADPITLVTPAYLPAEVVAEAFGVDKKRLRELNPALHHGVWNGTYFVPADHDLGLPGTIAPARAEDLLRRLAEHFGFSAQQPHRNYEVRLGDSLSEIAQLHDTSTRTLLAMNRLRSAHQIRAGQVLRVPMGPAPEPLGAGAAAMLAARQASDGAEGEALAADLPRLIAVTIGDASLRDGDVRPVAAHSGGSMNACREDGSNTASDGAMGLDDRDGTLAASPTQPQPDLAADPADYGVAPDGTIEIQIDETLGHYAEWLGLRSGRLRKLNRLRDGQTLIVGRRLNLEFSNTTPERFEQQRIAYQQTRQLEYFARHQIAGVIEHPIAEGDSLWQLAVQQYDIPLWLLRQYNPDIDTDTVLPLQSVVYVPVVEALPDRQPCLRAQAETITEGDA